MLNLAATAGAGVGPDLAAQADDRLRHDLRQSLAAVMALAAVIADDPLHGTGVLRRLSLIVHETDSMVRLLAPAAPDARSGGLDVGDLVSQQWAVVAAAADCTVRLVRDPGPCVDADEPTLRRSVRNLLDNAVRAAGPDGQVVVRVLARGDHVLVEVADSGPGFGRIPTRHGLGLITVRRFATAHGGTFAVGTSRLGGALVSLRLPAHQPAHQPVHQPQHRTERSA